MSNYRQNVNSKTKEIIKNGKYAQQLEHSTSQARLNLEFLSWVNITSF